MTDPGRLRTVPVTDTVLSPQVEKDKESRFQASRWAPLVTPLIQRIYGTPTLHPVLGAGESGMSFAVCVCVCPVHGS